MLSMLLTLSLCVCTVFASDPNDQSLPVKTRLFSAVHGCNESDLSNIHDQTFQILSTKAEGHFSLTLDTIKILANCSAFLNLIQSSQNQRPWMMDSNSYTHSNIPEHLQSQYAEPFLGLMKIFTLAVDTKRKVAALNDCGELADFEQNLLEKPAIAEALVLFRFVEKSGIELVLVPTRHLHCSLNSRFTHAQSKRFVFNISLNFDHYGDRNNPITKFYHSLKMLQGVIVLEAFGNSYLRDKNLSSQSISASMCQAITVATHLSYAHKDAYINASPHLLLAAQAFDLIYNGEFSPVLGERVLGLRSQELDELIFIKGTPQPTLEKVKSDFQEQFISVVKKAKPDLAQSNTETFLEACTAWLPSATLDTLAIFPKIHKLGEHSFLRGIYAKMLLETFLNRLLAMRPNDKELIRLIPTLVGKCSHKNIVQISLQAPNCSMPCLLYLSFQNGLGEIKNRLVLPRPDVLRDSRNFDLLKASCLYFECQLAHNGVQRYIFDGLCHIFLQLR